MDDIQLPAELQETYVIYSADETYALHTESKEVTAEFNGKIINHSYTDTTLQETAEKFRTVVVLLRGIIRVRHIYSNDRSITRYDVSVVPKCMVKWKVNVDQLVNQKNAQCSGRLPVVVGTRSHAMSNVNPETGEPPREILLSVGSTPETKECMISLDGKEIVCAVVVHLFPYYEGGKITSSCVWIESWENIHKSMDCGTDDASVCMQ